eukprot:5278776-Amphidinium_carterae.1
MESDTQPAPHKRVFTTKPVSEIEWALDALRCLDQAEWVRGKFGWKKCHKLPNAQQHVPNTLCPKNNIQRIE